MSQNPYAPPRPALNVPGPSEFVYRPAGGLVTWLTAAMVALVICNGLVTVASGIEEVAFPGLMDREDYEPDELFAVIGLGAAMALGGLGSVAAFIATAILFCVTANRLNKNARALGAKGMEFTPGWTVGWFFIPIANLFKPYQAIREVYRASDPSTGDYDWRQSPVLAPLGWWWAAWIIGNIVDNVEFRISWRQIPVPTEVSLGVSALSLVFTIASGVLAICVLRAILARQEQKAAAQAGKPPVNTSFTGNAFA